jgi:hypothetical protein
MPQMAFRSLVHALAVVALLFTSAFAVSDLVARQDEAEQICCDYTCDSFCKYPKETCLRDSQCNGWWPPPTEEYTCCPGAQMEG